MQKIYKFNQYLLEKYPTIWNTKIVWMLLASVIIHILFFIIGYISHADPVALQKFDVRDDYFEGGMIFIHLIISVLMIVGWLILMFKNNAFKNFYPFSRGKLFLQFLQYFVIIFASTTFFFSYMTGFKMFIKNKYPDKEMAENVALINKVYPFFSQELENYTLDNKTFPQFSNLYCETDIEKINRNQKYFVYYDRVYQYNTLYSKTVYQKDKYGDYLFPDNESEHDLAYDETKDNSKTYYFKKDVVDVSPYIKTTGLSYYNFSTLFYKNDLTEKGYLRRNHYNDDYINDDKESFKKEKFEINKITTDLLNKKDPAEIEKLMNNFLKISKKFGIQNNIDAKGWAKMVYAPENFEVHYFIKKYKNNANEQYDPLRNGDDNDYSYIEETATATIDSTAASVDGAAKKDAVTIKEFNPDINNQLSPTDYFRDNLTDYYYRTEDLRYFLGNVDIVKSTDFFSENIHIYLWIAFFLSTFIFSFRITGLKSLLFSIISAGVLFLAVILITVLYSVSVGRGSEEFFVSYLVFFIGLLILLIPMLMMKKVKKLISSIFINISMNGFVLFVLLIVFIITLHQEKYCREISSRVKYSECETLVKMLDLNLSYIILIFGFIFMYLYTSVLQKWKAMPQ
ncbi:hypothetical protein J3D55_002123 [Chryseobacterium ginsenosidimutans]|uniref:hypothetical protein n=1 Tax=Chryseobacterium ginsenosidimutans TaxID=687846 RepID=UPI00216762B9|nr:hypothetical protein [Chryseobacterium ginsenosidimutans]MCS3869207.1 hypothetical protein [Chryseobacterium ginsenosidimutans]